MENLDISLTTQAVALLRIFVAGLLSAAIGYERQRELKPAQLRDHVLVSVGACLFTVIGLSLGSIDGASRVAANVVTGIGFLGAGVILRQEGVVRGLTTAASIWVVAAIGTAVGLGLYLLAAAVTFGIFFVLRFLHDVTPTEGSQSE